MLNGTSQPTGLSWDTAKSLDTIIKPKGFMGTGQIDQLQAWFDPLCSIHLVLWVKLSTRLIQFTHKVASVQLVWRTRLQVTQNLIFMTTLNTKNEWQGLKLGALEINETRLTRNECMGCHPWFCNPKSFFYTSHKLEALLLQKLQLSVL